MKRHLVWTLGSLLALTCGCGGSGAAAGSSGSSTGGSGSGSPQSGSGSGNSGNSGSNGNGSGSGGSCPSSPAPAVFGNALCLCGDFTDIGNFVTHHGLSGGPGSVGVNGAMQVANHSAIAGSCVVDGRVDIAGDFELDETLRAGQGVHMAANLTTGGDLDAGLDVDGYGRLAVSGVLRVGGSDHVIGFQQVNAVGAYQAQATPPCPCDAASILDVPAIVAAAASANGNGAIGLGTSLDQLGLTLVTLPTGSYYFHDVHTIGATRLRISGSVALYLDGSVDQIGADSIVLDPGATLDLYVSGSVGTIGYAGFGDAADPSAFRLFVGGSGPITLSVGAQWFYGSIYAPRATIEYIGDTTIAGGLFADQLSGIGQLVIEADLPTSGGGTCGGTGSGGGAGGGSGSGGSGGAGSGGSSPTAPPVTTTPPIS